MPNEKPKVKIKHPHHVHQKTTKMQVPAAPRRVLAVLMLMLAVLVRLVHGRQRPGQQLQDQ